MNKQYENIINIKVLIDTVATLYVQLVTIVTETVTIAFISYTHLQQKFVSHNIIVCCVIFSLPNKYNKLNNILYNICLYNLKILYLLFYLLFIVTINILLTYKKFFKICSLVGINDYVEFEYCSIFMQRSI